jgi:ribonuclease HI
VLLVVSGVCRGSDGAGGWGYVSCDPGGFERVGQGAEPEATADRMELLAVIEGLKALGRQDRSIPVRVVSASKYLVNGATGRRERTGNTDLWARLEAELRRRPVLWEWEPQDTMAYQTQAYELAARALRRALGPGSAEGKS